MRGRGDGRCCWVVGCVVDGDDDGDVLGRDGTVYRVREAPVFGQKDIGALASYDMSYIR